MPVKNGNRRLGLIILSIVLIPVLAWIFSTVIYGGIRENKAQGDANAGEITRIEKEAIKARDSIDRNTASQLYELRTQLNRIEFDQRVESKQRHVMDSSIIYKLDKIDEKIGF